MVYREPMVLNFSREPQFSTSNCPLVNPLNRGGTFAKSCSDDITVERQCSRCPRRGPPEKPNPDGEGFHPRGEKLASLETVVRLARSFKITGGELLSRAGA